MNVPVLDLKAEFEQLRGEILPALERVCTNASFILGAEVEAFEREFADFCGTKHCVALANGTAALHLGLLALGVQPDDEVITTPNTFLATAEAISYCGAVPVFVDIDPTTANLDPKLIERAITERTRAILGVASVVLGHSQLSAFIRLKTWPPTEKQVRSRPMTTRSPSLPAQPARTARRHDTSMSSWAITTACTDFREPC